MNSPHKDDVVVADKATNQKDSGISVDIISYASKWLSQLCKTAERDLFIDRNVFQWNSSIERILKPRNFRYEKT